MVVFKERFYQWMNLADEENVSELTAVNDDEELKDRFYKDLEFGTGGMRGVLGP